MYLREILVYISVAISLFLGGYAFYKVVQGSSDGSSEIGISDADYPESDKTSSSGDSDFVEGIDVSHWDGDVSWPMVRKSGVKFAYIKATQGSEYVDPKFLENWSESKDAKILRGAYHFYQPREDPSKQAAHFLETVPFEKGDLIPVLDIEISSGIPPDVLGKDIAVWLEKVEQQLGVKPIIYTDNGFWDAQIEGNFGQYDLWIADWQAKNDPVLPSGWSFWTFWQYDVKGKVKGIDGASIDLDRFNSSVEELKRLTLVN